MKARFIKYLEDQAQNMTIGKEYIVLGIEGDSFSVICDENEPYLYEPEQFEIIDSEMPKFWLSEKGEDGELYAYPPPWFRNYFFEDYFDNVKGKKEQFWATCKKYYGINKNV